jgi:SAM-dependent methyltransferase
MPEREQWQVMGNAAEIYQRALVPAIFGPWAARVVEVAGLRPVERVLDVACGTGVVARLAAEAVGADGRVAALDMNPGMLAVAAAVPAKGAAIEWVEGSAQALPFADAGFDAVCCQLGLQYFPDREGALREMARVAVPGGRVVVMVWRELDRSPGFPALAEALGRTIGSDAEAVMRAPFALGDAGELSALLAGAGLRDCAIRGETGNVSVASRRHSSAANSAAHLLPRSPRPRQQPPARSSCARSSARSHRLPSRARSASRSRRTSRSARPDCANGVIASRGVGWQCVHTAGHCFHATGHGGAGGAHVHTCCLRVEAGP